MKSIGFSVILNVTGGVFDVVGVTWLNKEDESIPSHLRRGNALGLPSTTESKICWMELNILKVYYVVGEVSKVVEQYISQTLIFSVGLRGYFHQIYSENERFW
jgi:hypothetical protein